MIRLLHLVTLVSDALLVTYAGKERVASVERPVTETSVLLIVSPSISVMVNVWDFALVDKRIEPSPSKRESVCSVLFMLMKNQVIAFYSFTNV